MPIRGVDHIGIAVPSREVAEAWLRRLGLTIDREEVVEDQGVNTLFIDLPNIKLELLVPIDPAGPVAKFLERRGPGMHHLAFEVDDVEESLAAVQEAGVQAIDTEPRSGVENSRIAFLHPRDTGKVLTELVELADELS